jgi:hypothetical protein
LAGEGEMSGARWKTAIYGREKVIFLNSCASALVTCITVIPKTLILRKAAFITFSAEPASW